MFESVSGVWFFETRCGVAVDVVIQERQQAELLAQRQEKEMDHLEPFLIQLNVEDIKHPQLTRQQALKLRDDCMADLKQRLVDKANMIQASFEKVTNTNSHSCKVHLLYSDIFGRFAFCFTLFLCVNIRKYV